MRLKIDSQSTAKDHVYGAGFYRISYTSECTFGVGTHGQLGKKPHPVLESTYRIGIGLDTLSIPIRVISYCCTDSSGDILIYSRYPTKLRW
jgi:hypothetical protein